MISVIMSVYNGEEYLQDAVLSILNQTYNNFEFIIIEDASTDTTGLILSTFNDKRIKVIKNENNIGLTKSLNKALEIASGKYVARMDADDISVPERFEKQIRYLNSNLDISFCGSDIMNIDGTYKDHDGLSIRHEEIKLTMLKHNPFVHSSMMWRKEDFDKFSLRYDESFVCAQDYELWSRAILVLNGGNLNERLIKYRQHNQRISIQKLDLSNASAKLIRERYCQRCSIVLDPETEQYHYAIFGLNFKYNQSAQFLKKVDEYMYQFRMNNLKSKIFSDTVVKDIWRKTFFGSSLYNYNLQMWKVINNSYCIKICRVTIFQKIIFFIKCIIQRKNPIWT